MSTNYYWISPVDYMHGDFDDCRSVHIGASSHGWCFALHVIPERGIHDLPDWQALFDIPGSFIVDEYGSVISADDLVNKVVLNRGGTVQRHTIDGRYCIAHGKGTYDLFVGEFS